MQSHRSEALPCTKTRLRTSRCQRRRADAMDHGPAEPGAHVASVLLVVQNQGVPPDPRVSAFGRVLAKHGFRVQVVAPQRGGQPRHESVEGVLVQRFAPPPEAAGALGYTREIAVSLWRI